MDRVLQDIVETHTTMTPTGTRIPVAHAVDPNEVEFLTKLVADLQPTTSLEVGLAMGVSALAICGAFHRGSSSRHIVIDPFQTSQPMCAGIGLYNLVAAGYEPIVEFHETPSYRALPQLEASQRKIDFGFIDGWHTFDYALVDFFYIDKMLRVGGVVVFDDADWPSIRRVIRYVATNLPYSVFRVLPDQAIRASTQRQVYDSVTGLTSRVLDPLSQVSALQKPVTRAFGADLLGTDRKLGLKGSMIAIRKDADDSRDVQYHREF